MTQQWALVIPVKLLERAKTRLHAYGAASRGELALAFATDVVTAALSCPDVATVVVVTDDPRAATTLRAPGVWIVPDRPGGNLNAALTYGAGLVRAQDRLLGIGALPSDLPALRGADLAEALDAAAASGARACVADADGEGTTLLTAQPGSELDPRYGTGSRLRHRASGAIELAARPSLRRDVDTPGDLEQARALGVGDATRAVLSRLATA